MGNENIFVVRDSGAKAAIIFLHGFSGRHNQTWNSFLAPVLKDPFFNGWDILSLGYPSLKGGWLPFWNTEPSIDTAAKLISTLTTTILKNYKALILVAHSMGGLVAQSICVESKEISEKVSHLIHYGTPSGGLQKARPLGFLNKQARDMKPDSDFLTDLRSKWVSYQEEPHSPQFRTVAGTNDAFVPTESSLAPFHSKFHAVVPGDHLQIVRPKENRWDSIEILKHHMTDQEIELSPLLNAALAVERMEFLEAISLYEKHADELDEEAFVLYALALDSTGKTEKAISILDKNATKGTDTQGVLAGRLKRRWFNSRRQTEAERAYQLYSEAYAVAEKNDDHDQCHYHAINSAFMSLAYDKDKIEMEEWAKKALTHAQLATNDKWSQATIGEAYLYLGDTSNALESYRSALASGVFQPREIVSIAWQITNASSLLDNDDFENGILNILDNI